MSVPFWLVLSVTGAMAEIRLEGSHAFTALADDPGFSRVDFDDSNWQQIPVPSSLRAAGIAPRTDVFWYRIRFEVPADWSVAAPAIRLGVITRSDETYLNGRRIGGLGQIGPRLSDWHVYAPLAPRLYPFDAALIKPGTTNVLAIRGAREPYIDDGGIIIGPVALVDLSQALDGFLKLQNQFTGVRYLFFGFETVIMSLLVLGLLLGLRSRLVTAFCAFYIPAYAFTFERRGIAALLGLDGPALQFIANILGALSFPALISLVALILRRRVGLVGRTIQCLSILTLVSIPGTAIPALQWWVIESHLVWHALLLVGLLLITVQTSHAALKGQRYAMTVAGGLLAIFAGIFIDILLPLNVFEREFGFRIGELGILCLYAALIFVVIRHIADRQNDLQSANLHIKAMHEEERARMARDLHDGIGQWLLAIKVKLDLLKRGASNPDTGVTDRLDSVANDIEGAIEDVRRVSHDLAPALLDERGLIGAMQAHADRFRAGHPAAITLRAPDQVDLDRRSASEVFRIFQEALSNALRHSNCHAVVIEIEHAGNVFSMTISDDGDGFASDIDAPRQTLGIKSMQSRASLLGARLDLRSAPGAGTHLSFVMSPARDTTE